MRKGETERACNNCGEIKSLDGFTSYFNKRGAICHKRACIDCYNDGYVYVPPKRKKKKNTDQEYLWKQAAKNMLGYLENYMGVIDEKSNVTEFMLEHFTHNWRVYINKIDNKK